MYGNRWPGPTPSGVSTGKISRSNRVLERRELVRVEIGDGDDHDLLVRECRPSSFFQIFDCRAVSSSTRSRIACERDARRQPVGGADDEPGGGLIQEAGDADHEELVEVRREEAAHLDALEQRQRVVGREVEEPGAVLERRELAVEQAPGGLPLCGHGHRSSMS